MSEQEQYDTPENKDQQVEKPVDVMSLKKIDMTREDYDLYTKLEPDDPQIAEFLARYGIVPREPIIVSATDSKDVKNSFFGVVATGDDPFTTNRLLTNELEARLLEVGDSADQDPAFEQERIVPKDDIEQLGDLALEATGVASETEAIKELGVEIKSGLTAGLVESLASRLADDARYSRESVGRRGGVDKATEIHSLLDAFRKNAVSKEDLLVLSGTLLGASSEYQDIDGVFSMIRGAELLLDSQLRDLSTQLSSIAEMNSMTRPQGDRMKIGYINSVIDRAQRVLGANDYMPNDQYRLLLGLITGLSTRVDDRYTSQNFIGGALNQLYRMDIADHS